MSENYFENLYNIIMILYCYLQLVDTRRILKTIAPNVSFEIRRVEGTLISNISAISSSKKALQCLYYHK